MQVGAGNVGQVGRPDHPHTESDEPVAGHGPFVMNTPREIQQAFADLHHGRLGKIPELAR